MPRGRSPGQRPTLRSAHASGQADTSTLGDTTFIEYTSDSGDDAASRPSPARQGRSTRQRRDDSDNGGGGGGGGGAHSRHRGTKNDPVPVPGLWETERALLDSFLGMPSPATARKVMRTWRTQRGATHVMLDEVGAALSVPSTFGLPPTGRSAAAPMALDDSVLAGGDVISERLQRVAQRLEAWHHGSSSHADASASAATVRSKHSTSAGGGYETEEDVGAWGQGGENDDGGGLAASSACAALHPAIEALRAMSQRLDCAQQDVDRAMEAEALRLQRKGRNSCTLRQPTSPAPYHTTVPGSWSKHTFRMCYPRGVCPVHHVETSLPVHPFRTVIPRSTPCMEQVYSGS